MEFLNQSAKIDLTCPMCRLKFQKLSEGCRVISSVPVCGAVFKADQFSQNIKAVEKTLKDFARKLDKRSTGKSIVV